MRGALAAMRGQQDPIHQLADDIVRQRTCFLDDLIQRERHGSYFVPITASGNYGLAAQRPGEISAKHRVDIFIL